MNVVRTVIEDAPLIGGDRFCFQRIGDTWRRCIRPKGHAGGCLPRPPEDPRSANDPIEVTP